MKAKILDFFRKNCYLVIALTLFIGGMTTFMLMAFIYGENAIVIPAIGFICALIGICMIAFFCHETEKSFTAVVD